MTYYILSKSQTFCYVKKSTLLKRWIYVIITIQYDICYDKKMPITTMLTNRAATQITAILDNILKLIFLYENCCLLIKISLKFVPKDSINNRLTLVLIMAWCWKGKSTLFEPMMA